MRRLLVCLCVAGLAVAAAGDEAKAPIEAQARDGSSHGHGGGHGGGGHGGGGHSSGGGGGHSGGSSYASIGSSSHGGGSGHSSGGGGGYAAAVSSSYSAPVSSSYSAPSPSYGGGSTGNLYYYYYPVQEQHHKYPVKQSGGGGGLGILGTIGSIIIPIIVLGGILILIAAVVGMIYTNTNKRSMDDSPALERINEWKAEIERVYYMYMDVWESEDCVPLIFCELGEYSRTYNFPGKEILLSLAESYAPTSMQSNARLLKKAASGGFGKGQCQKVFKCEPPTSLS